MGDFDLPSEFDLIVVGTGFSESIIAAAASRVGKSVLHIDENEYYGGFWASFNLETFLSHIQDCQNNEEKKCRLRGCEMHWLEFGEDNDVKGWTKEKILQENRRFSIDLIPKMNFCNGKLVELLISSNICRYTEFRAVDKVLTMLKDQLDVVPGSRSDIFTKKNVSIIEKRLLMKFMTQCLEYKPESELPTEDIVTSEEPNDFKEFPQEGKFIDLMKQQRLTENLVHYILHSMCMGNETTTFAEGFQRVKTYLTSIGRYGNTPFLFPMYGCGEIPQCFCRLSAVFGGVYCLSRPLEEMKTIESNDEQVVSIKFGEQQITTKKLVRGFGSDFTDIPHSYISRAILITSSPVGGSSVNSENDGGGVVLMYHPAEGKQHGVTMIQLSHFSGCAPKGLYLVHLSTQHEFGAKRDLQSFIETFFSASLDPENKDDTKPLIFFSAFFEVPSSIKDKNIIEHQTGPVYTCCGPYLELDYDETIRQSKLLYEKMYPDDEFLPKAPEPDEIIMGDEDATEVGVNIGILADLVGEINNEVTEGLPLNRRVLETDEAVEAVVEDKIEEAQEVKEEVVSG